jgi:hypothetical protein
LCAEAPDLFSSIPQVNRENDHGPTIPEHVNHPIAIMRA